MLKRHWNQEKLYYYSRKRLYVFLQEYVAERGDEAPLICLTLVPPSLDFVGVAPDAYGGGAVAEGGGPWWWVPPGALSRAPVTFQASMWYELGSWAVPWRL